jgi:predicted RNA-binding Zn-ribbon protein involved in translation (DUF1610 family)
MDKNGIVGKTIEEDQKVLVTMRCIDMVSPTSDVDKVPCSECGEMTWLSAASRKIKFDKIICDPCMFKSGKYKDEDYCACVTEECINDALELLGGRGIKTTREEMVKKMEDKIGKRLKIVKK